MCIVLCSGDTVVTRKVSSAEVIQAGILVLVRTGLSTIIWSVLADGHVPADTDSHGPLDPNTHLVSRSTSSSNLQL